MPPFLMKSQWVNPHSLSTVRRAINLSAVSLLLLFWITCNPCLVQLILKHYFEVKSVFIVFGSLHFALIKIHNQMQRTAQHLTS